MRLQSLELARTTLHDVWPVAAEREIMQARTRFHFSAAQTQTQRRPMQQRQLLALVLVSLPCTVSAQAAEVAHTLGRLSVTMYLGSTSRGASSGLEEAMRVNGYDEAESRGCDIGGCGFGPVRHPASAFKGNIKQLSVRYRFRRSIGAELLLGEAPAGRTQGFRDSETLDLGYTGSVIAPLISFEIPATRTKPDPIVFSLGVGPAFLRTRWEYLTSENYERDVVNTTSTGAAGAATIGWPFLRIFHLDVSAQYRWFGGSTVRAPRWSLGDRPAHASASHGYLGAGIGVRF